jgi:hypothetical protein
MNIKVYNRAEGGWMTYHRDNNGHYSEVHSGLPTSCERRFYDEPEYRFEKELRFKDSFIPGYYYGDLDYVYSAVDTKTTRTHRDVFSNGRRLITRKYRPVSTYNTRVFLNY